MIINHNIAALNTHRQMGSAQSAQMDSMEKLSSGLRINSAKDDAAGLTISEKMRGQIRGLEQSSTNAQDGISLIQTAEGSLSVTQDILQRMRELSVQASNDTNTTDDRAEIQKEIGQLVEEIDRISSDTEFNTKKLLNGNIGVSSKVTTAGATNIDSAEVLKADIASGTYTITTTVDSAYAQANFTDAGTGVAANDVTFTAATANGGSYRVDITEDTDNDGQHKVELFDVKSGKSLGSSNNLTIGAGGDTATIAGQAIALTSATSTGSFTYNIEADLTVAITNGTDSYTTTVTDHADKSIEVGGLKLSFNTDIAADNTTEVTVLSNAIQFHVGANENQTIKLAVNDMSSNGLSVNNVDVTTTAGAESAITAINNAIQSVSSERSKLGATQNRLEHTINNLNTSSENLTAAESRIRDVDYAEAA